MGKFTKDKRVNKFHSYSKTVCPIALTFLRTSTTGKPKKTVSGPGLLTS